MKNTLLFGAAIGAAIVTANMLGLLAPFKAQASVTPPGAS